MNRTLLLGLAVIVTVIAITGIGCGVSPQSDSEPITKEPASVPDYLSIGIAVDLSKSGLAFKTPPFDPKAELLVFVETIIERGGGALAVTHISGNSDVSPATLFIEPGRKPIPPREPKIGDYDRHEAYYLDRNKYDDLVGQYQVQVGKYEAYCQGQVAKFWQEVAIVLSTDIDSTFSDTHSAINRLAIFHASAHPAITKHYTVLYGDGITDTPRQVPLLDTTNTTVFYWAHGTANPSLGNQQEWVATYQPIPVTNLTATYHAIFSPLTNQ